MNNEKQETRKNKEKKKIALFIFFIGLIAIVVYIFNHSGSSTTTDSTSSKEPDEIALMTYAQTVLKDNLPSPKYSSNKADYTFVGTSLRYKIEGKVNNEKFYMIIEFTDNNYTSYDLISLQVGNDIIYKK